LHPQTGCSRGLAPIARAISSQLCPSGAGIRQHLGQEPLRLADETGGQRHRGDLVAELVTARPGELAERVVDACAAGYRPSGLPLPPVVTAACCGVRPAGSRVTLPSAVSSSCASCSSRDSSARALRRIAVAACSAARFFLAVARASVSSAFWLARCWNASGVESCAFRRALNPSMRSRWH